MTIKLSTRQFIKTSLSLAFLAAIAMPKAEIAYSQTNESDGMKISSPAFENGGMMPEIYTQESTEDVSPPLVISGVPKDAKSLVLICSDPDAPDPAKPLRTFIHWVVVNLPPDIKELPQGVQICDIPGAMDGLNGSGKPGYIGPRPPIGTHRYFFRLYALDTKLSFEQPPTEAEVKKAMEGHIIAETETMGRYLAKKNR